MGLAVLILGLVLFIGPHVFVSMRDRRAALIGRIGELPYKALISVASLLGIVLIGWGFAEYRAEGEWIELYDPPTWTRHLSALLMWPAVVMVTAAYIPGNIKRTLKHPMLSGVKLWAVAHLIANGDLGSILIFGSILAWAVYDRITLKRRSDPGAPPIPVGGRRNDILAVVVGTILYLALAFVFHPLVIGRAVFGSPALGT
ncbi:NnrU family protein [Rhodoplanes roseus]|uniref:NnrU family protein n=1 Tax=Rhodoplanes roseus TaxID=29409 RepID=A0A327L231_9BRAD|nr:NnrU family protein [Rhodoplanes roseus]RAI45140.1 NnrU family protein [Rhodoplanes roseus]